MRLLTFRPHSSRVSLAVLAAATVTCGSFAVWRSTISHVPTIMITAAGCGTGWRAPRSGDATFSVHNQSSTVQDVAFQDGQHVVAEIPTLGPGVVRPVRVRVEPGGYSWRCTSLDGALTISEEERVGGGHIGDPSPGYEPVVSDDLSRAAADYRSHVTVGLRVLSAATDRLGRAVSAGRITLAKALWLTAHLDYARLGAAYGTFGVFADEIDGRADGLVGGISNAHFTGFLRLEYGLWHHEELHTLVAVADRLDRDVHALVVAFPHQLLPETDVPLRAHEILENALEFEMTGDTDEGSHTNLATVWANVDGTDTVLGSLAPLIDERDPRLLAAAHRQLDALAALLVRYRNSSGTWTALDSLRTSQREHLDSAIDAALSSLDQVPAQLELASGDNT